MKKLNVISLFSGCGGMDLGFEGNFLVPKYCLNPKLHPDWIGPLSDSFWIKLPEAKFKTVFANDIMPAAKTAWISYFTKRGADEAFFKHPQVTW